MQCIKGKRKGNKRRPDERWKVRKVPYVRKVKEIKQNAESTKNDTDGKVLNHPRKQVKNTKITKSENTQITKRETK